MSDLVMYSCLSAFSLNLLPGLLALYVQPLSSNLFGVVPSLDFIPLRLESLMKVDLFGVDPPRMLVSWTLTPSSWRSSLWLPASSLSVLVFD